MVCPVSLCSPSHHSVKLKRTDRSRNFISSIDDDALYLLSALQDLILPGNQLTALPRLRTGIEVLDIHLDQLQSSGIQAGASRVNQGLQSTIDHLPPMPATTHTHPLPSWGIPAPTLFWGLKIKPIFKICFIKGSFCCKKLI